MIKKHTIHRLLTYLFWVAIGSGLSMLLVAAIQKELVQPCSDLVVEFTDQQGLRMLDEAELIASLFPTGSTTYPVGKRFHNINLFALERQLEKNPWVREADLFFDQQQVLHINVSQRKPIVRMFTPDGNSFYLDEALTILPITSKDAISLPVFTNFYPTPTGRTLADTLLMKRMIGLSKFILADSFLSAQIEEVHISADQSFELYTQVGDQTVQLGLRDDWEQLFYKLKSLYQQLNRDNGWGKYASIDLQYKDLAVCVRNESIFRVTDTLQQLRTDSLNSDTTFNNKQLINPVKIGL